MIKYRDIQFLPEDNPLRIQFFRELNAEEECSADANCLDDEESKAYFDRYIAGDR